MRASSDTLDRAGAGLDTLLADLLAEIPAREAVLYTPDVPLGSPAGIWRTVGVPDESLRDYMTHFKGLDPWAQAATTPVAPSTGAVLDTDDSGGRGRSDGIRRRISGSPAGSVVQCRLRSSRREGVARPERGPQTAVVFMPPPTAAGRRSRLGPGSVRPSSSAAVDRCKSQGIGRARRALRQRCRRPAGTLPHI